MCVQRVEVKVEPLREAYVQRVEVKVEPLREV
jgi:hypothetical protein